MPEFKKLSISPWSGTEFFDITPDDDNDLGVVPRGVYIGSSGNLRCSDSDGTIVTFTALVAGVVHPIAPQRVYNTGTTAGLMIGVV